MRNINQLKTNLIVFACLGLFLSVAVWASGRISRKQMAPQELQVRVQNKTSALKIVSGRKVGEGDVADFEVQLMRQWELPRSLLPTLSSGRFNSHARQFSWLA